MASDRSTGPISREKFQEIVNAPFGEAKKLIRQYDPFWGVSNGEKITWVVEVQTTPMNGRAYVKAATQEEADKLADEITESEVSWDYDGDLEVISVEPHIAKR